MRKCIVAGMFVFSLICAGSVSMAQGFEAYESMNDDTNLISTVREVKPQATTADSVALIFYKLSNILPDFEVMARAFPDYEQAYGEQKVLIFNQRQDSLKNAYSLLTLQEPILVEVPVTLSSYSETNKGFFIKDFETSTFFPFKSHGKNFAVVPEGVMDWQWVKVEDAQVAAAMESANGASDNNTEGSLTAMVYLSPTYTDSSGTAHIEGKDYWLLSAEVNKIELYLPNTSVPVWDSSKAAVGNDNQKFHELIQLRQ